MNTAKWIAVLLFLHPGMAAFADVKPAASPNFVIILADDLGYGDLGCYGATRLKTPHLDRMAREGLRFTDFHANASICSPTRVALLTGRYQQRFGIEEALSEKSPGLPDRAHTIAEYLKPSGYATGVIGKWHLGSRPGSAALPNRQGFDEFYGSRHGGVDYVSHVDRYGRRDWWHNDDPLVEEGYATDLLTDHAVRFIEKHKDEPFFLYLSHTAIHFPWMAPEDRAYREQGKNYDNSTKVGPHKPEEVPVVVNRMIERLDDGVGRVMNVIRKLPAGRETLVVFTSDNGGYLRYGGAKDVSSNGILRGQKAGVYEGSHRVPCLAWWPGKIAQETTTDVTTMTMDLLPTILELAHVSPLPADAKQPLDGVSLAPLLLRNNPPPARTLFWRSFDSRAIRQGDWKVVVQHNGAPELYHLGRDPSERRNLAADEPQRLRELLTTFDEWERQLK